MKRRIFSAALAMLLFSLLIIPGPVMADGEETNGGTDDAQADETQASWPAGPEISADGAIVIEASSGSILYAKNIYDTFYPASTTKILTTLVALENSELNEIVTVSYAADNYVSKTSSRMGLVEGEQVTMEQALYGIMLESGNEATFAVGEHVGGSIAHFIKMMNYKAQQLGCVNSHFANSHGLHDDDHYTCCYDEALIARCAYQNPDFMKITGTATYAMPETNKNPAKILTNHHWFLNRTVKYDYCIGGKTGATTQAGYALVTYARKDGMTLISVVMHDETWAKVYADTMTLLDYAFDTFTTYRMSELSKASSTFPSMFGEIAQFSENRLPALESDDSGIVILPDNISVQDTVRSVVYNDDVLIGKGRNVVGAITYSLGDRVVGAADIVFNELSGKMTDAEYKNEWPSFMIPVEVAFEGVDMSTLKLASSAKDNKPESIGDVIDMKSVAPYVIGIGAAAGVVLLGLIGIAISRRRR
ncbi:MAG: D-alanyl-D-alanine carboxypeptidase [Lachnospiraceae bacterium]|nr:D-alanyl-D-alanine carboxypeptidase [Lachnospiraceae bacterium]MCR5769167.1 D-alanyl-D-alanine carboxypeptidase [Lachnospiraceae bacterium]